jgi:outer membrane immunogenic protein
MMKRYLLATVSGMALTGVASAADMPIKAPPPPPAVVSIWTGPYIGVNGGAVWHRMSVDTENYDSARVKSTGGTFGGQIGYNWQSQNFVFGLEADANWVGAKESHQQIANVGLGFPIDYTTKLEWLATVRARAGVAFGRTLVYGTGGLAIGGVKNTWTFAAGICCAFVSDNDTRVGWTAGGGIEHFVGSNVTVKAEALYVNLGRETAVDSFNGEYRSHFKNTAVIGRLGLNLKW